MVQLAQEWQSSAGVTNSGDDDDGYDGDDDTDDIDDNVGAGVCRILLIEQPQWLAYCNFMSLVLFCLIA